MPPIQSPYRLWPVQVQTRLGTGYASRTRCGDWEWILKERKDHTDHQDQPWSKIRSTAWSKRLYGAPKKKKKNPVILFLDISAYFRITLVFIEGIRRIKTGKMTEIIEKEKNIHFEPRTPSQLIIS